MTKKRTDTVPPLSRHQRRESAALTAYQGGVNLLRDGYTLQQRTGDPFVWIVIRPQGRYRRCADGTMVDRYYVSIGATPEEDTCDCDFFGIHGIDSPCRHIVGVRLHGPSCAAQPTPSTKQPAPSTRQPTAPLVSASGRPLSRRDPWEYDRGHWYRRQERHLHDL